MDELATAAPAADAAPLPTTPPPFSLGRLVGTTFDVWVRNLLSFSLVLIPLYLPILGAQLWLGPPLTPLDEGYWRHNLLAMLIGYLGMIPGLIATGALTRGVFLALDGRRASPGELLAFGLRKLVPVLLTSFNVGVRVLLWSLLLVVPGIIAMMRFFVAVPAQVAEPELGSSEAARRSAFLTQGRKGLLFLAMLIFWVVGGVAGVVLNVLGVRTGLLSFALATGLLWLVQTVLQGLYATAAGVAYHDLRAEKEGLDTTALARIFE